MFPPYCYLCHEPFPSLPPWRGGPGVIAYTDVLVANGYTETAGDAANRERYAPKPWETRIPDDVYQRDTAVYRCGRRRSIADRWMLRVSLLSVVRVNAQAERESIEL